MFRWLAKLFPHAPIHRAITVEHDDDGLEITRGNRTSDNISWRDVTRIVIRTTDLGPFDDDLFFVIDTANSSYWIPHDEAVSLIARLQEFDGFDNEAMIEAMSCTENREFLCWSPLSDEGHPNQPQSE